MRCSVLGLVLGLAALAACSGPMAPVTPSDEAMATYFLLSSFSGPSGTREARHRAAAETGRDADGEMCVGPIGDLGFERVAAAVAGARSPRPVADAPRPGQPMIDARTGEVTTPTYTFAETVLFSALSSDGRWLAFDGGGRVRDVDGRLHGLDPAGFEAAHDAFLDALIASDACPDVTESFRAWRDREPRAREG